MKRALHPGSIQKRILGITLSCLLGMCVIVSSVSYYLFRNYLQRSIIQGTETSLRLLADSMNENINNIYRMVRFCQNNSAVATYIENNPNPGSVLSVATYDRIAEEYNNNPSGSYMTRLAVVTNEHFLQIVGASFSSTADLAEEIPKQPFFDKLLDSKDYDFSTGFIKDPFYRNGKKVLPLIRPITYKYNSVRGGFLFIEISSDLFKDAMMRYATAGDSALLLSIEEHHYVYSDGELEEIQISNEVIDDLSDTAMLKDIRISEISDSEGESRIVVTAPLNMPGCFISQIISSSELRSQRLLFCCILGGVLISILGIGVLLMFTLHRMISVPVAKINVRMEHISRGDFVRDASIEWKHELGDIGRGINDLSENVLLLMDRRLQDEKQKRELEYKMLQSQINPHFIYNTLNSIKWMATIQGADGISEMTTALAKLLKSISKGTSLLVPVREELSLLQDYFTIQSYRYGGTVSMETVIDDTAIPDLPILKFTLQPLVENAIFHGIEPKGSGQVTVHLYFEACDGQGDSVLRIDVTDNGVGISREKAEQILLGKDDKASDFFREIGVSNVHKRLQYEFGEQYGISVESEEGKYTTMSIRIPGRPK